MTESSLGRNRSAYNSNPRCVLSFVIQLDERLKSLNVWKANFKWVKRGSHSVGADNAYAVALRHSWPAASWLVASGRLRLQGISFVQSHTGRTDHRKNSIRGVRRKGTRDWQFKFPPFSTWKEHELFYGPLHRANTVISLWQSLFERLCDFTRQLVFLGL